jgi:hypothetical protein
MNDDWDNAPSWAQYRATDADGLAWWYEFAPRMDRGIGQWLIDDGRAELCRLPCRTWKDSLETRPKEAT